MVRRRKFGRTTFLTLDRASILSLQAWLGRYRAYWGTEKARLASDEPALALALPQVVMARPTGVERAIPIKPM